MDLVYEYELVTIRHCPEKRLLCLTWENYLTSEDYRHMMRALLHLTQTLEIENWLVDARHSDQVQRGDTSWNIDYVGKILAGTKLRKLARIQSPDETMEKEAVTIVEALINKMGLNLKTRFFSNEQEAKAWLLQEEKENSEVTLA